MVTYNKCVKIVKNSQPFGKKRQKTSGGFIDSHCVKNKNYFLLVSCPPRSKPWPRQSLCESRETHRQKQLLMRNLRVAA